MVMLLRTFAPNLCGTLCYLQIYLRIIRPPPSWIYLSAQGHTITRHIRIHIRVQYAHICGLHDQGVVRPAIDVASVHFYNADKAYSPIFL